MLTANRLARTINHIPAKPEVLKSFVMVAMQILCHSPAVDPYKPRVSGC